MVSTIYLAFLLLFWALPSYAHDLKGKVDKKSSLSGKKSSSKDGILKGGVKDEASLNPSVKVIPNKNSKLRSRPQRGVVQFRGNRGFSPDGNLVPRRTRGFPRKRQRTRVHYIKPISSYRFTPRNGIMTFGGHQTIKHPSFHSVSTFRPGRRSKRSGMNSRKGVTTFVPGYGAIIQHKRRVGSSNTIKIGKGVFLHNGAGGGYYPGSLTTILSHRPATKSVNGVTAWLPGFGVTESSNDGKSTTVVNPGHGVTRIAYSKGVSSWAPGYEVSVQTNTGYKTSLGGMWFEKKTDPAALRAGPAGRLPERIFVEPVIGQEVPLLAKANLLPQLRTGPAVKNITWNDWYRSVASSIYTNWANTEIGPGTAKARVTVTRNRDISCEIVDFYPAPYVDRDMDTETRFKVAAFKAVRNVRKKDIPAFPPLSDKDVAVFDVMLKRTVDGPIGIDISKL